VQSPEVYLNELGISVSCVVDPNRTAVLDEAHRVFVNWETFYMADAASVEVFKKSPFRFSGLITDPVTRERFQPTDASPMQTFGGRDFYFKTAESAALFAADPDAYATPMIAMQKSK